jgi:hypothetical protein
VGAGAWVAAVAAVVSTLCDALVFAGGLYLLWLVRPLIGGSLARPYLLLAVGAGAFLVVDVFLVAAGATTQTELVATDLSDARCRSGSAASRSPASPSRPRRRPRCCARPGVGSSRAADRPPFVPSGSPGKSR